MKYNLSIFVLCLFVVIWKNPLPNTYWEVQVLQFVLAFPDPFPYQFYNQVVNFYKKAAEVLTGTASNCIKSVDLLGHGAILTILSLQMHEHRISLHLFRYSSGLFKGVLWSSVYKSCNFLLNLIITILLLLVFL